MEKGGKKYVLKESELREIILDTLLMENWEGTFTNSDLEQKTNNPNSQKPVYPGDVLKTIGNMGQAGIDWFKDWFENKTGYALGGRSSGGSGYGKPNPDGTEILNAAAACKYIKAHAKNKPTGWCARHVREALNYGGLDVPHGMRAGYAKDYINVLPRNGWHEISQSQAGQPCDVLVIDSCVDSKGRKHPYGHIAMCIGNGNWVSDFIQGSTYGTIGTPPPAAIHFYRYNQKSIQWSSGAR